VFPSKRPRAPLVNTAKIALLGTMPRRSLPWIHVRAPKCGFVDCKEKDLPTVAPSFGIFEKRSLKHTEISSDLGARPSHINRVFDFRLEIIKADGELLGLKYQPDGVGLRVMNVKQAGVVGRWNEKQKGLGTPEYSLQFGDLIVRIGDTNEPDAMEDMLHTCSMLQMHIERWPQTVVVDLEIAGNTEGLGVGWTCSSRGSGEQVLLVCYVFGSLEEWNKSAIASARHFEVIPLGSRIVRVDRSTSVAEMIHVLKKGLGVQVAFERPAAYDLIGRL